MLHCEFESYFKEQKEKWQIFFQWKSVHFSRNGVWLIMSMAFYGMMLAKWRRNISESKPYTVLYVDVIQVMHGDEDR